MPAVRLIRVVSLRILYGGIRTPLISVQIIVEKSIPLPPVIFTSIVPELSPLQEMLFPL